MEIYNNPKFVKVTYNQFKNYILFDWSNMAISLEELKELHTKASDVVKKRGVKTLVAETSKATSILFPQCIEWWSNEQVPAYDEAGINSIITVKGGNALTRLTNKSWQGATGGIDIYEVPTLVDAENIMQNRKVTL